MISDVIIKDNDLGVAAFAVSFQSFLRIKTKVVVASEILKLVKNGLILHDENAIVGIEEIPRIEKLLHKKYYGIGQKVLTKSGKNVGTVYDYLIESETLGITRFYVRHFFDDKIIPSKEIVKLEGKRLYIKDDSCKVAIPSFAEAGN